MRATAAMARQQQQQSEQECRAADIARSAEVAYERWTLSIEGKASRAAESARLREEGKAKKEVEQEEALQRRRRQLEER